MDLMKVSIITYVLIIGDCTFHEAGREGGLASLHSDWKRRGQHGSISPDP